MSLEDEVKKERHKGRIVIIQVMRGGGYTSIGVHTKEIDVREGLEAKKNKAGNISERE